MFFNQLPRQCKYITVEKEESIQDIIEKYQTTLEDLISSNPDINLEQLNEGQELCIPIQLTQDLVCPIGSIPYEIQPGDTLSSIATQFATTDEAIASINPEIKPNNLEVGQVICIIEERPKVPNCPSLNIYVVTPGDTISSIAQKFGIPIKKLLEINPSIDPYNLRIDQIICLPFIPTPYIIVIEIASRRLKLYYLGKLIKTYVVAIGKPTTPTPLGQFKIVNKQVNPGGPFGTRWLGLSEPSYGIHGNNRPESIGTAASNGCIRMYNQDVEELFSIVAINTPVIIL